VRADSAYGPDWRDSAAYALLLQADRSLFAWEWLRRDPRYAAAAGNARSGRRSRASPQQFGLVAFEPPGVGVPHARPLWSMGAHPFVLFAAPSSAGSKAADGIDLRRMHDLAKLIVDENGEHLLLSDGFRAIRLDGPPGAFTAGAVCLRYSIGGLVTAERQLLALRRFLALCRTGRFSRSLHRREARARRWIILLRVHDALVAGVGQRQIAAELLSSSAAEPLWRIRESSIRSQVQRLVGSVRRFAAGEYRSLLR
jgi:type VI secretion system activator RovC-like protein/transcriptional regulator